MPSFKTAKDPLLSARATLVTERDGLKQLEESLGADFIAAVDLITDATRTKPDESSPKGRIIVSGMGKSGHIGNKIAATLASTGTPAYFVHPAEASHGDLGMITPRDVILALSWSGDTPELTNLLSYAKRFDIALIAFTSNRKSALGRNANICLCLPRAKEACPNGLAPTTSTTMQLALGDALAIALLERNDFSNHDFKNFHPGGVLGASLKRVSDLMHKGDNLPLVSDDTIMAEALVIMTQKGFGCLGIIDTKGALVGIITDGDLRRHMNPALLTQKVSEIMTHNPETTPETILAGEALAIMNANKIQCLFICTRSKPIGLIRVFDLLHASVA